MGIVRGVAILALLASAASAADPVLLGSRREGWLEAFRLENLETIARVRLKEKVESVESPADGQRLFVSAPHPQQPEICCALWMLDPHSLRAFAILWPAFRPVLMNNKLFAQRGDDGIEVFDARSLAHLPTLRVPGVYNLTPSPDGRWLFGTRQFPTPGLDIFDLAQFKLTRAIPVEGATQLRGIWLGAQYYLFAPGLPGAGRFWAVDAQAGSLGQQKLVRLGEAACAEPDYEVVAAGDRVAIYSPVRSRSGGAGCIHGGYLLADPATSTVSARLAPELPFVRLVAGPDGKSLYGVTPADTKGAKLIKLDAASGQMSASRTIAADVWNLGIGGLPAEWQGRLDLQAAFQ
ncbi:MAG TPA: hypothetical protein VKB88_17060 [Bryobacteraceae bacterium]|nr:hypothetical protein [Bryobacteraceae bacterium]